MCMNEKTTRSSSVLILLLSLSPEVASMLALESTCDLAEVTQVKVVSPGNNLMKLRMAHLTKANKFH